MAVRLGQWVGCPVTGEPAQVRVLPVRVVTPGGARAQMTLACDGCGQRVNDEEESDDG